MPIFGQTRRKTGVPTGQPSLRTDGHWCVDGLALYTPMLAGSGGIVKDYSPYGNHGTMQNMDPATDWVGSKYGAALDFDGGDDHVAAGSIGQLNTWTIGFYALADNIISSHIAMSQDRAGWNNDFLFGIDPDCGYTTDNRWAIVLQNASNEVRYIVTDTEDADTTHWQYMIGTYNGSRMRLYRDGTAVDSLTRSGLFVSDQAWWIGACPHPTNPRYFDGGICCAFIYDRALSQQEIRALCPQYGGDPWLPLRAPQMPVWEKQIYYQTLTESVSTADTDIKQPQKPLAETANATDQLTRELARMLTDSTGVFDTLTGQPQKLLSDSTQVNDSIVRAITRALSDEVAASDNLIYQEVSIAAVQFILRAARARIELEAADSPFELHPADGPFDMEAK